MLSKPQLPPVPTIQSGSQWSTIWVRFGQLTDYLRSLVLYLQTYLGRVEQAVNAQVQQGPAANRPSPGNPNALYYATDTAHLYIDNGTAWVLIV